MSAATQTRPAPPQPRRGAGRTRETLLCWIGLALIALHVLDDRVVQPEPGVGPGDHVVSTLVPLALLGLAAWAYPRLRGGRRGALALVAGVMGVAGGIEAFHYTREVGASGDDFTGWLSLASGVMLLGLGAVTLWRTRSVAGALPRRIARRAAFGVAGFLAGLLVLMAGYGYVTTHVARAVVPPNHLGVPSEDVAFETADGLELRGWYIPSRNGAAVIAFPGRSGPQKPARVLARHGYGVLLFDRRGEGESDGDPNSWGWGGEADIEAAIAYLRTRPDVDPDRIGGIGLSVGGEMMIEAAAETGDLRAVVSEGAGARSTTEDMDEGEGSVGKWTLGLAMSAAKTAAVAVSSDQAPPPDLEDLAADVRQPMLLIAAPESGHGERLNRDYAAAAPRATLWEIPESTHVGGLQARPEEYERRVVGFFDEALR
jgi:dienelactone hydrolase